MRGTGWVDRGLFLSRRFAGAACLCCAGLAHAAEESGWDRSWSITQLYRSETGWIRSVDVSGRFHYDIAYIDSDAGYWHDYDVRRMRLGGKIGFAGDWLLHVEGSFDYNSWEEELEASTKELGRLGFAFEQAFEHELPDGLGTRAVLRLRGPAAS